MVQIHLGALNDYSLSSIVMMKLSYLLAVLFIFLTGCSLNTSQPDFEGTWKREQNIFGETGDSSTTTFSNGAFEYSAVSWSTGVSGKYSSRKTTITGNYEYTDDGGNKYTLTMSDLKLDTDAADLQTESAQQAKIEQWSMVKLKMVDSDTLVYLQDDGSSYEIESAMYLTRQ